MEEQTSDICKPMENWAVLEKKGERAHSTVYLGCLFAKYNYFNYNINNAFTKILKEPRCIKFYCGVELHLLKTRRNSWHTKKKKKNYKKEKGKHWLR